MTETEVKDGKVKITIREITVEFDQELRPLERIIASVLEFFEGYHLVDKKGKKIKP